MFIRRKRDNQDEDKARAIAKERERRRRKMIRTKYGQTPLKHAKKGIQSCVMAVIVVAFLCSMVIYSFHSKGKVALIMGAAGIVTLIMAGKGFHLALKGFKEGDKNYITCKAGIVGNGIVLLGMTAIFLRGLI